MTSRATRLTLLAWALVASGVNGLGSLAAQPQKNNFQTKAVTYEPIPLPKEAVFSVRVRDPAEFEEVFWGSEMKRTVYVDIMLDTRGVTNGVRQVEWKLSSPSNARYRAKTPVLNDTWIYPVEGDERLDFFDGLAVVNQLTPTNGIRWVSRLDDLPTQAFKAVARYKFEVDFPNLPSGEYLKWQVYDTKVLTVDNDDVFLDMVVPSIGSSGGLFTAPSSGYIRTNGPFHAVTFNRMRDGRVVPTVHVSWSDGDKGAVLQRSRDLVTWVNLQASKPDDYFSDDEGFSFLDWASAFDPLVPSVDARGFYRIVPRLNPSP